MDGVGGVAGVNDAGTQVWLLGGYAGSERQNPWLHWSQTLKEIDASATHVRLLRRLKWLIGSDG